jgi:LPS-assembly protein
MINRYIKKISILIISLIFFYPLLADEFNFEVTEIQIYENGNIIKGIKGGTVTSKNNIVIEADNFEYNKSTLLLVAKGNVKIIDTDENIIIESQEVFYEKDIELIYTKGKSKANNSNNIEIFADKYFKYNKLTSLLEANGNVLIEDKEDEIIIKTNEFYYLKNQEKFFTKGKTEVVIEDKYIIDTKDLIFLRNENLLSSNKKSTLKDTTLNNFYKLNDFIYSINQKKLKGTKVTVITNELEKNSNDFFKLQQNEIENKSDEFFFETGFFDLKENKFLGKDVVSKLHKTLFGDNENDPRINSVFTHGNELNTFHEKAVFTSCKKTDKCPPWKISSDSIQHDRVKKQIIYKNSWLELYDVPVFYFPKFFHPDPSVKRQSGLLKPELGSHNTLGDSIYIPYFYVLSEDMDITIKPRLFNNNKMVLQNEYRQLTKKTLTVADFSITKGHDSSAIDKGDTRTHFFLNTKVDLDLKNFESSKVEINYEKSSNDNYLKLFDLESPLLDDGINVLETLVKFDLVHEKYDFSASMEMYETLSKTGTDRYQYVLPQYNFSKTFFLENFNGDFNFNSSGNNTLNKTNILNSKLSNDLIYTAMDNYFHNGIKTNFEVLLKNINTVGKKSNLYKNSPQSELMSSYIYNTSLPLTKNTNSDINLLEPKISFRFSPHDMKNNNSLSRRIDANSIFNSTRLGMGDTFEEGQSITLGLDFIKEKLNKKNENTRNEVIEIEEFFDFKLATVFRFNEESKIPSKSTLNKKTSNIFGKLNFTPNKIFSLDYDFSVKNDLNTLEYNSIVASLDFGDFSTQLDFEEQRGAIGQKNIMTNTAEYKFDKENSLSFRTRRDRLLSLTEYYDLIYEYKNDCLVAGVKYKKTYYKDTADLKPIEELFFTITIVPLTTFSPDKLMLSKYR